MQAHQQIVPIQCFHPGGVSLLICSRIWGFETPSWIQKLQEPIAGPVASNSWIHWLHWTGSSLVVATGCTERVCKCIWSYTINPSFFLYLYMWYQVMISYVCDGGKDVLRLTSCMLPKKCGKLPASKVLWSFRQSCTLASSASGFYRRQFLVCAICAYQYRISNAFKRTMCMIHHDTSCKDLIIEPPSTQFERVRFSHADLVPS